MLELGSQNDIELHVKELKRRGIQIEIENSGYSLAGFDQFKKGILAEIRRVKYRDLEDGVYRNQLT